MASETCELEALSVRSVSVLSEEDAEVATQVARHLLRRRGESTKIWSPIRRCSFGSQDAALFMSGSNEYGQLGLGKMWRSEAAPSPVVT